MILFSMAYGIPRKQILLLQDTLMQTRLEMLMIGRPRGCFYVENNLVAWMSRKQASISLSTAEAEYIAGRSCYTQLLLMKKLLCDYEFTQDTMIMNCDNTSAINISKNPVQHSRTKHIDIRHHFLCDLVESEVFFSLSFQLITNWLTFLPNLWMVAGLSPFEKPLVCVTCLRHAFPC
jgi:hypothetical protein